MQKFTVLVQCFFIFMAGSVYAQAGDSSAGQKPFEESKFYLKASLGAFTKTASIDPELRGTPVENVANDFKSGNVWSIEAGLRVGRRQSIGLTHSRISQNSTFSFQSFGPGSVQNIRGEASERINYTGLNYSYHFPVGAMQRSVFYLNPGIGLWNYNAELSVQGFLEKADESNVGYQFGAGYEFRITRNFGLFADLELLTGNVTIDGTEENLSQTRYGIGIAIRL